MGITTIYTFPVPISSNYITITKQINIQSRRLFYANSHVGRFVCEQLFIMKVIELEIKKKKK